MADHQLLPNVKNVIPVASGKGGVGKSTVSANLAIALSKSGATVGLMDADVYGPSIPTMMGASAHPMQADGKIIPPICYGIKIISMGFFLPKGDAVIWRGPMLAKVIDQFLGTVDWGELDYLIVDLPPGTGDIQLSLCQRIPLTGAVIVSTPQDLAFHVAEKAIAMFKKLHTPILGLVENMSGFECKGCGHREEIFGSGGARRYAEAQKIPFLGEIPIATDIRMMSDEGKPITESSPDSPGAWAFMQVAQNLEKQLSAGREENALEPLEITQPTQNEIRIRWKDGSESSYGAYELRLACSCAECQDEVTGARRVPQEWIKKDVYPLSIERVGRYGVRFQWSDGHSTGIYTFERLRALRGQVSN
ncbi:MAG TPA: P-loop NTPase [bacterium]|nr:P-loop NTPase [bacterium]